MASDKPETGTFANESLLSIKYYQDLVAEQLQDQLKNWKRDESSKKTKINENLVIQFSTLPLASVLKRGPEGKTPPCMCPTRCRHVSFFEALREKAPLTDFCPDRNSFLVHRLPVWLTGLKNKREFLELPTVYHVYNVFSRGTYWWKVLSGQNLTNKQFHITREARLILMSCTGQPLDRTLFLSTNTLLGMPTSRAALGRLRNWLITLDGLLISILLGSQGHAELCNWEFFDKVMQTYLKTAVSDLFNISDSIETYYGRLKANRNLIKDKVLKERTLLPRRIDGKIFDGNFWFFNKIIEVLKLDVDILNPSQLITISYLTQTRSCGLPPKPIEVKALKKWRTTVGKQPTSLTPLQKCDISRAVDSLCLDIKSKGNFEGLLNHACSHSKISLSNSASFTHTREQGGKIESARILLNEIPDNCPFFDLDTGEIIFRFRKEDTRLTPGEKLFHYSILLALTSLTRADNDKPHIGDIRYSTVLEPGKARVISISRVEHAAILHPLAHFFSVILATFPSSKTGLTAANHMWDTYKRIGRENIPADGIYSGTKPTMTYMGSEDWSEATDSLNPYFAMVVLDGFSHNLGLPKFYVRLCKTLLTMPRRVYSKEILHTNDFKAPELIKFNGILMGDPLCKAMLHSSHLVSRKIAVNHLRRIGANSITPPFSFLGENKFGSIPNPLLLKKRFPRPVYLAHLKGIFKREEQYDIKSLLGSIKSLTKRE
jgi:hypothetical protein